MARDDDDERIDGLLKERGLLPFPTTREQHDVAAKLAPPFPSGRDLGFIRLDVELEAAAHFHIACAEGTQALGVRGALPADGAKGCERGPRQRCPAPVARRRS